MLIDADAISRALTASGGAAIPAIALQLGAEFITAQGALDRDRMREKAFADPTVKRQLESIIHPLVGKTCLEQAQEAIDQGLRCAVLDIPLLVESGHWRSRLHRIVVIDCEEQTQIDRVAARNALPRDAIEKIIRSQATRVQRRAVADAVIFNDRADLASIERQINRLADLYAL